jgi:hypothetical protein
MKECTNSNNFSNIHFNKKRLEQKFQEEKLGYNINITHIFSINDSKQKEPREEKKQIKNGNFDPLLIENLPRKMIKQREVKEDEKTKRIKLSLNEEQS